MAHTISFINKCTQDVLSKSLFQKRVEGKWLHSVGEKEFFEFKKESKETGGGPSPKQPLRSSGQIMKMFQN